MTVRRWEAGLRPQPAHLRRLCAVFDASPDQLGYGLRGELKPLTPIELPRSEISLAQDASSATEPYPGTVQPRQTAPEAGPAARDLTQARIDQSSAEAQTGMPATPLAAGVLTGWLVPGSTVPDSRITISGSRAEGTDGHRIDDVVRSLSRLLVRHRYRVVHGPVGVGIEVMTHIADHYRPPGLGAATGVFGRANVVRDSDFVLVVGGGEGTQAEFDIAVSMAKKVIPMPSSGGAAARIYAAMQRQPELRSWISEEDFEALGSSSAEDYMGIVERLLAEERQAGPGA